MNGARVALLEGRMARELASLVRRHGGEPFSVPAVRELPLPCGDAVAKFLDALRTGGLAYVVLLTGVGVVALFAEAERLGRRDELERGLRGLATVCRGPKPAAALKKVGIPPTLNVSSPFTALELIAALSALDVAGKGVALVHYGERSSAVGQALRDRGAEVLELCLYEWALPEDSAPLCALAVDLAEGRFAAVAFTSQVQVRHLFRVATEAGHAESLARALTTRVVVATVGPTCSAAVESFGVTPHVMPDQPKMGPMVEALAKYLSRVTRA
jgi:uroporphyrinogen-III synthase